LNCKCSFIGDGTFSIGILHEHAVISCLSSERASAFIELGQEGSCVLVGRPGFSDSSTAGVILIVLNSLLSFQEADEISVEFSATFGLEVAGETALRFTIQQSTHCSKALRNSLLEFSWGRSPLTVDDRMGRWFAKGDHPLVKPSQPPYLTGDYCKVRVGNKVIGRPSHNFSIPVIVFNRVETSCSSWVKDLVCRALTLTYFLVEGGLLVEFLALFRVLLLRLITAASRLIVSETLHDEGNFPFSQKLFIIAVVSRAERSRKRCKFLLTHSFDSNFGHGTA